MQMFFFSCEGGKYPRFLKEKQMLCIAIQLDRLWETIYRKFRDKSTTKGKKVIYSCVDICTLCVNQMLPAPRKKEALARKMSLEFHCTFFFSSCAWNSGDE